MNTKDFYTGVETKFVSMQLLSQTRGFRKQITTLSFL